MSKDEQRQFDYLTHMLPGYRTHHALHLAGGEASNNIEKHFSGVRCTTS
jgi:hypothetical protein